MSATRVFWPTTWTGLRDVVVADGIGPAPFLAHAVTDAVRAGYPEGTDEDLEYVAAVAASRSSLGMLGPEHPARRVVVAVDAGTVVAVEADDPTLVEVGEVAPFRTVAAVLVDEPDVGDVVAAAAGAWGAAEAGDADAEALVERCLERDLSWYATQEVAELLDRE